MIRDPVLFQGAKRARPYLILGLVLYGLGLGLNVLFGPPWEGEPPKPHSVFPQVFGELFLDIIGGNLRILLVGAYLLPLLLRF